MQVPLIPIPTLELKKKKKNTIKKLPVMMH